MLFAPALVITVRLDASKEKDCVGCGCCLPADSNLTVMELHAFTLPPHWLGHRLIESLNKHKHTLQHSSPERSPAKRFQKPSVRSYKANASVSPRAIVFSASFFQGQKPGQTHFHFQMFRSRIGHEIEKVKRKKKRKNTDKENEIDLHRGRAHLEL